MNILENLKVNDYPQLITASLNALTQLIYIYTDNLKIKENFDIFKVIIDNNVLDYVSVLIIEAAKDN